MNLFPPSSTAIHPLSRRNLIQYSSVCISSNIRATCSNYNQVLTTSSHLDKVTFGTKWIVKAKHGEFYQAIATDTYKNHSLNVTIKMGEPQVSSGTQFLMGDAVD
ncbi:hypothetical protein [Nostoc sp. MG11]|uniref:hypothetical protein n=1 Tax=Nostoc sp. MG11 TaxID=2721166 RepID=UPI00186666CE|nr:hypothetical protein [Nostoc sp. MG11]